MIVHVSLFSKLTFFLVASLAQYPPQPLGTPDHSSSLLSPALSLSRKISITHVSQGNSVILVDSESTDSESKTRIQIAEFLTQLKLPFTSPWAMDRNG